MGTVYVATCTVNNKQYIGKTVSDLLRRKLRHEKDAPTSPFPFHRALMKYGFDKFGWVCCFESDDEAALLEMEMNLIAGMKTQVPGGYNVTAGGDGFRGVKKTEEHRRKIGDAHRGRKLKEETKRKLSEAMKGKPSARKGVTVSDETRRKISESHTGKKMSDESKLHLSNYWKGRISPMKGRHHSEESKLKLSTAQKGRKKSETCRENMRLAALKRWRGP